MFKWVIKNNPPGRILYPYQNLIMFLLFPLSIVRAKIYLPYCYNIWSDSFEINGINVSCKDIIALVKEGKEYIISCEKNTMMVRKYEPKA